MNLKISYEFNVGLKEKGNQSAQVLVYFFIL